MSLNLNDKKRVLDICKLRRKLAQVDYQRVQKDIAKLEVSGQQLGAMAGQMLDIGECTHAAALSAKLEFGHRLVKLQSLQTEKIAKEKGVTTVLQVRVFQRAQTEDRAQLNFQKAKKSNENNRLQGLPVLIKNMCLSEPRSRKDMKI